MNVKERTEELSGTGFEQLCPTSASSHGSLSVMERGNQTESDGTADPHASDNVQEMAQEELEIVCARLAQQLEQEQLAAAGEAAALAEQLKQA